MGNDCRFKVYDKEWYSWRVSINIFTAANQRGPSLELWKTQIENKILDKHFIYSPSRSFLIDRTTLTPDNIIPQLKNMDLLTESPAQLTNIRFVNEEGCDWGSLTQDFLQLMMKSLTEKLTNNDNGMIINDISAEDMELFARAIGLCLYMHNKIHTTRNQFKLFSPFFRDTLNPVYMNLALMNSDEFNDYYLIDDVLKWEIIYTDGLIENDIKEFLDDTQQCTVFQPNVNQLFLQQKYRIPELNTQNCAKEIRKYIYNTKFKKYTDILNNVLKQIGFTYIGSSGWNMVIDSIYQTKNIDVTKLIQKINKLETWGLCSNRLVQQICRDHLRKWVEENKNNSEMISNFVNFWGANKYEIPPKLPGHQPIVVTIVQDDQRVKLPESHTCFKQIIFYLNENGNNDYQLFKRNLEVALEYGLNFEMA